MSIRAAAREVGVSRASGTNWARSYSVYRAGQLVRTVAPLDRLASAPSVRDAYWKTNVFRSPIYDVNG
ncbi:hypothetical protein [Rhodococcus globerulus]|uniref:hypothetical protein n=1 Tax=Rhodococcus globerulus TaxID=33008 RepID=UPI003AFAE594